MSRIISIGNQLKNKMEKQVQHFDYLVIGAGSGGIGSGRWAAKNFGVKVGIIEHQRLGGEQYGRTSPFRDHSKP